MKTLRKIWVLVSALLVLAGTMSFVSCEEDSGKDKVIDNRVKVSDASVLATYASEHSEVEYIFYSDGKWQQDETHEYDDGDIDKWTQYSGTYTDNNSILENGANGSFTLTIERYELTNEDFEYKKTETIEISNKSFKHATRYAVNLWDKYMVTFSLKK